MNRQTADLSQYVLHLEQFQGPLDLLLKLIEERELEITEISLAEVADQFLAYLQSASRFNLEIASDFAVIASRLLEIKAKTLLPPVVDSDAEGEDPQEEDPAAELVRRLQEYRQFKQAAQLLRRWQEEEEERFPRIPEDLRDMVKDVELEGVRLGDLLRAMESVLQRAADGESSGQMDVTSERYSLTDAARRIIWRLRRSGGHVLFEALFQPGEDRLAVVVTFLALLQLLRERRVAVRQVEPFAPLEILWRSERT